MALSGNLGFVPLDEVLRLLTRSDQQGAVDVWGQDVRGRIFISKKGIGLATTSDDNDLRRHLINSGYVDEAYLNSIEAGTTTMAPLADKEADIIELLREMTVESLYQMSRRGSSFEVTESLTTPYASPRAFELEAILEESRRRAGEWIEVEQIISDLDAVIQMNRELGDQDSVKISRDAWRLLCEMGSGASVRTLAERLGTTDFWTARVAAGLSDQHLLVLAASVEEDVRAEPVAAAASYYEPPVVQESAAAIDEDQDPNESWWVEPQVEETDAVVAVATEEEPEPETHRDSRFGQFRQMAAASEEPTVEQPQVEAEAEAEAAVEHEPAAFLPQEETEPVLETPSDLDAVEEDTEAFLEKVFSQLENNGQPEEEGHGLLRRRRLGSVLKELNEDD
ncbi:MAG: hypothetical protein M3P87_04140 [Actinomycetota bacterium]|nr:hypothetical protein [Actinomycetota bacterium]